MKTMKRFTTVSMDAALADELRKISELKGWPVSSLVVMAIKAFDFTTLPSQDEALSDMVSRITKRKGEG